MRLTVILLLICSINVALFGQAPGTIDSNEARNVEVFVIPLEALGTYTVGTNNGFEIDLGVPLLEVREARLYMKGSMTGGVSGYGIKFHSNFMVSLMGQLPGGSYGWYRANSPSAGAATWPAPEPFSGETVFTSTLYPSWDFMLDGIADVRISINTMVGIPGTPPNQAEPEGVLDEAYIILEAVPLAPITLRTDSHKISVSAGGTVNLSLDAGPANAGRSYLVLGSLSGKNPGLPLPNGGEVLPLNMDGFSDTVLRLLNTSLFSDFFGQLDGLGQGTARINGLPGINPSRIGKIMTYAFCLEGAPHWDFASSPVDVGFVP